jgi:hypothetical protein
MHGNGQSWPLQFFFLVMLIGAAIALIEPSLFAGPTHQTLVYWLIGGALASAIILYIPALWAMYVGIGALLNRTAVGTPGNPAAGTLLRRLANLEAAIGNPANLQAGTLLARIGTPNAPEPGTLVALLANLEAAIGTLANPQAGTLLARIGTPNAPEPGTLVARLSDLEIIRAAIGTLANPQAGTLLARIGTLETLCRARSVP